MTGTIDLDRFGRGFGGRLLGLYDEAVAFGGVHPWRHAGRLRRGHDRLRLQLMKFARILADQHAQRIASDFELVVGSNLLRCREVEARLRLVGVGDRRRADLEVLLRLLELLRDRCLVGLHRPQVFDREEDVEVGLGDAQDQILSGLREVGLGLHHQQFRLVILNEILPAKQRLRQVDAIGIVVVAVVVSLPDGAELALVAGVVPEGVAAGAYRRQQAGERLRLPFATGFGGRPRGGVLGVVA
jgi:hypothetical protein